MAFEFLDALGQVAFFGGRVGGVGEHDVAPAPEELGPLQGVQLHFAADVLGPLPPLEFEELDAQLFDDVFGDAQAAILNIGLNDDVALALVPFPESFDPTLHFRRADDAAALDIGMGVHAADVFPAHDDNAADGGADGHGFPVHPGDLGGPQGPGKGRER